MKINCLYGYNFDSNIYVIDGKIPTIIDCGTGIYNEIVVKKLNQIIDLQSIKQIILTHEHYDHCGGVKKFINIINEKPIILAHSETTKKLKTGVSLFAQMIGG